MRFIEETIERITQDDEKGIYKMIVKYLCGEIYYKKLSNFEEKEAGLLSNLLNKMQTQGINYAQFNELLLLLEQDRVSKAFFNFFFGDRKIKLKELKGGIIKFRGFAMLRFGNFRFAYKQLSKKNKSDLEEDLKLYLGKIEPRPPKALDIEKIERNHAWYNGYITKKEWEKQSNFLRELLESKDTTQYSFSEDDLLSIGDIFKNIGYCIEEVELKASSNTDIYLTWEYMDVYIATSMRNKWEFEETYDFINEVFNDPSLKQLNLRCFDPTQSYCENRIDKGLIEGLMLKRSLCTIYMAQEVDTMGKDSELAATLAQGKPVIAYVPNIDIEKHAKKIEDYPLDFFKKRFLILQAEGVTDEKNCRKALEAFDPDFEEIIADFIKKLGKHRSSQPFSLWHEREKQFKKEKFKFFPKICKILATAEHHSYEERAITLKDTHPLAIQVALESGVANGVLVVRDHKMCAKLLHEILTNSMNFSIKRKEVKVRVKKETKIEKSFKEAAKSIEEKLEEEPVLEEEKGSVVWILEEKISGCPFRVVTEYDKLSNSFWNFYLIPK